MAYVNCKVCVKRFYAKPSWLKVGHGKYCSAKCQYEDQKTGTFVNCFTCNKKTYKTKKELRVSRSKKYFCTKSCQTIWRNSVVFIGKRHPNWRGGLSHSVYRGIMKRSGRQMICNLCNIRDKRVLAVHHIDHNRSNNNLENLIWLCHNCHFLVHRYEEEKKKIMVLIA